ncbi:hypothetical protein H2200_010595 [Cladophialophora chaetospira]|uniref:BZIP domain-containing protein n=1 Tax=Cladophialophora chaetospira TaxID=386627 RepID=A0AA38X1S5_9EURO|nr:hypothetical protein H2200_010595 [Cladophialophora chaetospira]
MTLQSALTRNTLNQRASRARRKDYIHTLEQRLHAYEAHGVQATAEVQAAARRVAGENAALREEVGMLREQCAALEGKISVLTRGGVLGEQDDGDGIGRGRRKGHGRNGARKRVVADQFDTSQARGIDVDPHASLEQQGVPSSAAMPSLGQHTTSIKLDTTGNPVTRHTPPVQDSSSPWPPENTPSDLDFPSPQPSLENNTYISQYPTPPIITQSDTPSLPSCSTLLAPNSTPCLQAALIIASMRGIPPDEHSIEARILPELGCLSPSQRPRCISSGICGNHHSENSSGLRDSSESIMLDCAVDNGRLFGIMAREE